MVKAAKSLGAAPWQVIAKVVLPSALPTILAGYLLGAGIALLLVVSAEMINATSGIGFLIFHSGDLMMTGKLMVGLATLSLLGLASTSGGMAGSVEGGGAGLGSASRARPTPVLVSGKVLAPEAVRAGAERPAPSRGERT